MPSPVAKFLFLLLLVCGVAASDIYAAQLTVTKVEDTNDGVCDADCSLREAVAAAASGDTIVFSSLFNTPQTITLQNGQITIDKNLTITGTGPTLVDISANLVGRVFFLSPNLNVTISGMKLRDGRVGTPNPGDAYGGAISIYGGGALDLSDMEFTNNQALGNAPPFTFGEGSAVYCDGCTMTLASLNVHHNLGYGAAIQADHAAVINISNSIISNNNAGVSSPNAVNIQNTTLTGNTLGGVGAEHLTIRDSDVIGNTGRGVVGGDAASTMDLENCTISQNTDEGVSNSGTATITSTRISNNQSTASGAGISTGGTMYLVDAIISGNLASTNGGGITANGNLFLTNSTVSGNTAFGAMPTAGLGGGIYAQVDSASHGRLSLTNSTISNNQSKGGAEAFGRILGRWQQFETR
jgi:CSLREA domain-containing protein